jgi:dTDP-4-dehydrorhamnose 3,5-epimerase
LYLVETKLFLDARGSLQKYFESDLFSKLDFSVDDIYTTHSHRNVIRGMHHQIEPYGQVKFVSCVAGSFFDVALDLRRKSKTYGKVFTCKLESSKNLSVIVPSGFSHGTYSLQDDSIMLSICSGQYIPHQESGFNMRSLNLPFVKKNATLSEKDILLPDFV